MRPKTKEVILSNLDRSEISDLSGYKSRKPQSPKGKKRILKPLGICLGLLVLSGINEGLMKAREYQWNLLIEQPAKQAEALTTACETLPIVEEIKSNLDRLNIVKGNVMQPLPIPEGLVFKTWIIDDRYNSILDTIKEARQTCESENFSDQKAAKILTEKPSVALPNTKQSRDEALAKTLDELNTVNRKSFENGANKRIEDKLIEDDRFNYPQWSYLYPIAPLHLAIRYGVMPVAICVIVYLYRGFFMMVVIFVLKIAGRFFTVNNRMR